MRYHIWFNNEYSERGEIITCSHLIGAWVYDSYFDGLVQNQYKFGRIIQFNGTVGTRWHYIMSDFPTEFIALLILLGMRPCD